MLVIYATYGGEDDIDQMSNLQLCDCLSNKHSRHKYFIGEWETHYLFPGGEEETSSDSITMFNRPFHFPSYAEDDHTFDDDMAKYIHNIFFSTVAELPRK